MIHWTAPELTSEAARLAPHFALGITSPPSTISLHHSQHISLGLAGTVAHTQAFNLIAGPETC